MRDLIAMVNGSLPDVLVAVLLVAVGATVGNIIAACYAGQAYRPGQQVRIGDVEGRVIATTPTTALISTRGGRVAAPASWFSEEVSMPVTEEHQAVALDARMGAAS